MNIRKQELQKRWNQLDRACEALERLQEIGFDKDGYVLSEIVSIKNKVEVMIDERTRK